MRWVLISRLAIPFAVRTEPHIEQVMHSDTLLNMCCHRAFDRLNHHLAIRLRELNHCGVPFFSKSLGARVPLCCVEQLGAEVVDLREGWVGRQHHQN